MPSYVLFQKIIQRRIERIDNERKRQHGIKEHREIVLSYYFNEYLKRIEEENGNIKKVTLTKKTPKLGICKKSCIPSLSRKKTINQAGITNKKVIDAEAKVIKVSD